MDHIIGLTLYSKTYGVQFCPIRTHFYWIVLQNFASIVIWSHFFRPNIGPRFEPTFLPAPYKFSCYILLDSNCDSTCHSQKSWYINLISSIISCNQGSLSPKMSRSSPAHLSETTKRTKHTRPYQWCLFPGCGKRCKLSGMYRHLHSSLSCASVTSPSKSNNWSACSISQETSNWSSNAWQSPSPALNSQAIQVHHHKMSKLLLL